jgi:CheY-like chemotaxis protein
MRVLVVDDDADAADTLAQLLGFWGHDVFVAYDGPTALELARLRGPDVVLLDLAMPGMDGYAVAKQLRRQMDAQNLVLIAVTGRGETEVRRRSVACGFAHHLLKPLDLNSLRDLLASLWSKQFKAGQSPPKAKRTQKMRLPKDQTRGKG